MIPRKISASDLRIPTMKGYDPSKIESRWPRKARFARHGVNKTYDPSSIEPRWQKIWEKEGLYRAEDFSKKSKYYLLVEFPYPSGERLHVGHGRSYCSLDAVARMMRMKGKNVLFPMGWDAFGLPAENYALKTGIHPSLTTKGNIEAAKKQVKSWGLSFDWEREINTTDPSYYKWTQWIFLQFFKKGFAYKAKIPVNWCPKDKINLADEEVIAGCCERCETPVERRVQSQWMLKITEYADRLLKDLDGVDYPEHVKEMQRNWIGRSEGALVRFPLATRMGPSTTLGTSGADLGRRRGSRADRFIEVFTTRLDTIFGATFLVLAPEHPFVAPLLKIKDQKSRQRRGSPKAEKIKNFKELQDYIRKAMQKSELERQEGAREKTGIFTGLYAQNPATQESIPVWISDFVLPHYGTGAIMAVPAHDQRDFEFAKRFKLPIKGVIKPVGGSASFRDGTKGSDPRESAFTEDGVLVNSARFSNLSSASARKKLLEWLGKKGLVKEAVTYRLRDWVFSRQHYWGEPIPIIYCRKCWEVSSKGRSASGGKSSKLKVKSLEGKDFVKIGRMEYAVNPVPEKDLPVELPYVEKYKPTGTGESPLASVGDWVEAKCPVCGSQARRETDTMPNWAGSSWYFLAYTFWHKHLTRRVKNTETRRVSKARESEIFESIFERYKDNLGYWMPIDWYNGGLEHTTLHLLYSRFWYKFLSDLGLVPGKEPFAKRTSHGVVLGPDGYKMSKSRENVVNPDEVIEEFGSDTFRIYEMFMGPFDQMITWDPRGVLGVRRFLDRIWKIQQVIVGADRASARGDVNRKLHRLIKKVEEDTLNLKFNTAIAGMMEFVNAVHTRIGADQRENNADSPSNQPDGLKISQPVGLTVGDWEIFLRVLAPFAPHLAEELWQDTRNNADRGERGPHADLLVKSAKDLRPSASFRSVHKEPWPVYNPKYLEEDIVMVPVQINGRLRGVLEVQSSKSKVQSEVEKLAKADPKIARYLEGKTIKKVIFIPGKLINFVLEDAD